MLPGARLTASLEAQPASGVLTGRFLCRGPQGLLLPRDWSLYYKRSTWAFIALADLQALCLSSMPSPINTAPQDTFPGLPA